MADLSVLKLPNNQSYNLKDASAVASVTESNRTVTVTKRDGTSSTFSTAYALATTSADGLLSKEDKSLLSSIDGITHSELLKLGNVYFYVDEQGRGLSTENDEQLTGGTSLSVLIGDTANNLADCDYSVAIGTHVTASSVGAVAFGKYNQPDANYAFSIGNGTDENARSNAISVSWGGDVTVSGNVISAAPTASNHLVTKSYVDGKFLPLTGGTLTGTLTGTTFVGSFSGTATQVGHTFTIQINSGTTEGTNKFTFNGSANKSINFVNATTSADGFMSASDKSKLNGIAAGANAYTHPSYTAKSSGLYKITVDAMGHVSAATAVVKADITALGIPAQDTTYSVATASANGLMPSGMFSALNVSATQNGKVLCVANGVLTWKTVHELLGLTDGDSILYTSESE